MVVGVEGVLHEPKVIIVLHIREHLELCPENNLFERVLCWMAHCAGVGCNSFGSNISIKDKHAQCKVDLVIFECHLDGVDSEHLAIPVQLHVEMEILVHDAWNRA